MDLTIAGAVVAGLATSLHCAAMCGPLACGLGASAKTESERLVVSSLYHAGRLASYGIIGAICGAAGKEPLRWFFHSPAVLLPWALVLALLVIATGMEKRIPRPRFLTRFSLRWRFKAQRLPAAAGAALTGLFTPFLPCGPLYAVFIAVLAAGSAARGAEVALAFGIGTVPLLWAAQHGFQRLRQKVSPARLAGIQRGLALVTALVLAWRLHGTLPVPGSEVVAKDELPSCCHGSQAPPLR